jgi:hypothetical protein
MARTPFTAAWLQIGPSLFQWGKLAAYWKGAKGWWASRKGYEGIQGPFRTPGAAQRWAEEPFREAHRTRELAAREKLAESKEKKAAQKAAKHEREAAHAQAREAQALVTWKGLLAEARVVRSGQVWALRDSRHATQQILVVEVKKTIAVVLARPDKGTPWKGLSREPRTLSHLPKLYRLVGTAKVPASSKA